VEKNVRATVMGFDETVSLLLVEHLNFARRHASLLVFKMAGDFMADPALFCNRRSRPQGARAKGKKGKSDSSGTGGGGVSLAAHRYSMPSTKVTGGF
jgi:hypothetical protein